MLCRNDRVLGLDQTFGKVTRLELLFRAQNGEVEARRLDTHHLMSSSRCTQRISVGESMTQAITCGIGMALDNS